MGAADLRRIDALLQMRNALIRFRDATGNIPAQVRVRIERAEVRLRRKLWHLEAEIRSRQALLADCEDDDERSDIRQAIADVRIELDVLRDRCRSLATAIARYDRATGSWQRAIGKTLPAAAAFLGQKHADAVTYQRNALSGSAASSVEIEQRSIAATTAEQGAALPQADAVASIDPASARSPDMLPGLPSGLTWVSIDWVDPSNLPTEADFRKGVTYAEMREGFQRMWREIIPLLIANPAANRATFEKFDDAHDRRIDRMGFVHPSSLTHLWDQLLDRRWGHHIRIEIDEPTGQGSIVNGRHRVKVARDIGWHYVPAELVRVKRPD
jgi:hypothetical protein